IRTPDAQTARRRRERRSDRRFIAAESSAAIRDDRKADFETATRSEQQLAITLSGKHGRRKRDLNPSCAIFVSKHQPKSIQPRLGDPTAKGAAGAPQGR